MPLEFAVILAVATLLLGLVFGHRAGRLLPELVVGHYRECLRYLWDLPCTCAMRTAHAGKEQHDVYCHWSSGRGMCDKGRMILGSLGIKY